MATKKKAQNNAPCTGFRAEIHAALMAGDYDAYTGCATREEFTAAAAALAQIELALSAAAPMPTWLHDKVIAMGAVARDVEGADGKLFQLNRFCDALCKSEHDGEALRGSCKRLGELLSSSWPECLMPNLDALVALVKDERAKPIPGASSLAADVLELAGVRGGRNGTVQKRKAINTAVSRHAARRRKGS